MNIPAFSSTADGRPRRHLAPISADPAADDDDHTRTERIVIHRCAHGANAVFCAACSDHAAEAASRASLPEPARIVVMDSDADADAIAEAFANANAEREADEDADLTTLPPADQEADLAINADADAFPDETMDAAITAATFANSRAASRRRRHRIADTESLDNPRLLIDEEPAPIPAWLRTIPDPASRDAHHDCAPILCVLIICACITLVTLTLIALASFPP